jgi:hypothetical protein
LWLGRHGPDLDKTESQILCGRHNAPIFVESCCKADWIAEGEPADTSLEPLVFNLTQKSQSLSPRSVPLCELQPLERALMGTLGITEEKEGTKKGINHSSPRVGAAKDAHIGARTIRIRQK